MALTEQQAAAYEKMEEAVAAIVEAFPPPGADAAFMTAWTCVANFSMRNESNEDEMATMDYAASFSRRGQSPAMTRGIVENWLDSWRGQ